MPFAATPKFPGAVAAVGDLLNQANRLASSTQPTFASAITAAATTATLVAGTGAIHPTDNYTMTSDSEIILVSSRSGDTLTFATRGYQGTTAASHSAGANADAFITAVHHNQLAVEVNAIETQLGINLVNVVLASKLGANSGVATLDGGGKLTASQVPTSSVLTSQSNNYASGTKQSFAVSASAGAGVNVGAAGAAASSPTDGDFYIDATTYLLKWRITPAPPAAPTLGSAAGGALAATTYFVKVTGIVNGIESAASAESSRAVLVNNVLTVTSPTSSAFDHYNVYVSTATGTETKQNASPILLGTNWTEPTSGLISGTAAPSTGSGWMNTTNPANATGGGSGAVASVFGRTGAVVAASNDYAFSQLSGSVADAQLSANVPLINASTVTWGSGNVDFSACATVRLPHGTAPGLWAGRVFVDDVTNTLRYDDYTGTPVRHILEVTDNKGVANGYHGLDSSAHEVEAPTGIYPKYCNFTAVTASAAVTTAQNLMLFAVPAGYVNILTRALRVKIGGNFDTSGSACTFTVTLAWLNINGCGNLAFSVPASQSVNAWMAEYILTCTATGASGSFSSFANGTCQGATAPATTVDHAAFTQDMTPAMTLQVQATFSVASTANVCRQYYMIVERLNW